MGGHHLSSSFKHPSSMTSRSQPTKSSQRGSSTQLFAVSWNQEHVGEEIDVGLIEEARAQLQSSKINEMTVGPTFVVGDLHGFEPEELLGDNFEELIMQAKLADESGSKAEKTHLFI